ncbi:hypothetical protein [Aeromonas veronii]|uniref:Uncharacterized protein n=1 Tax=Aeromonas veronii TaxID=654 RepID=A0A4V3Z003_AERVE|nr:hypothetical protein [Aeromonas veronii]THJ45012.1 hypothetical protein E8Q35_12550 [Aeromonas veronii]
MTRNHAKIITLIVALLFSGAAFSSENENCISAAEVEFGIPTNVLKALFIHAQQENSAPSLVGPMKLYTGSASIADKQLSADTSDVNDACRSYRVAAWWLMNPAGGRVEKDIWVAVKRYFHGDKVISGSRDQSKVVKAIYESMTPTARSN